MIDRPKSACLRVSAAAAVCPSRPDLIAVIAVARLVSTIYRNQRMLHELLFRKCRFFRKLTLQNAGFDETSEPAPAHRGGFAASGADAEGRELRLGRSG